MTTPIPQLYDSLELFGRAGGGGSDGGSGGGGEGILIAMGYIPMHFVGALLRKRLSTDNGVTKIAQWIGWVVAAAYAIGWSLLWQGMGVVIGLAALVGMAAGLYNLFSKLKPSKRTREQLSAAASQDSVWDERPLLDHVKTMFMRYQADWSNRDVVAMRAYMTDSYYPHAALLVAILLAMGRRNVVENVEITDAQIMEVADATDNAHDRVTVGFTATARDTLVATQDDRTLFVDTRPFTEYWTFARSGNDWLLDNIAQESINEYSLNRQLQTLARRYGYYYSGDMGWLFIPERGQLFDGSKFGTSDINNHIVGLYNQQLLVQVYTYTKSFESGVKPYVVAQVNVPKQYGNIIVRRKKFLQPGVRGLERVETEWTQFNKKYEVFATSAEQATSFELLNPTYMEQLEALPFEVVIEVVDTVIYLYVAEQVTSVDVYTTMLDLLNKAFKELRL